MGLCTIDVHAHFLPPVYVEALKGAGLKSLDGGIPVPQWSEERALSVMDDTGIAGAVLSISSPHVSFVDSGSTAILCRTINDEAAQIKYRHPNRLGAYAILPLPDVDASLAELDYALGPLGLDGIALPTNADGHYLGDVCFRPLLEALNNFAATVFIHPTSPCCFASFGLELPAPMIEFPFDTTRTVMSLLFSGALAKYSRIKFILSHGGGTLPFLAPRIAAVGSSPLLGDRAIPAPTVMRAFSNLYYDTALCFWPEQIAALRTLAPVKQIVYGSDFPFANETIVKMAEHTFSNLTFTSDEQRLIRCENASGLFGAFVERCRSAILNVRPT